MEGTPFLPLPDGMLIEQLQITDQGLLITVVATHPTSCCPLCAEVSSSIHSTYRRQVRDVSCGGRHVQLVLIVRKFFCRNALCQRKIFTERLPQLVEPWARMTVRLCEALQSIGLATCGKGGARLAERLSIQTSRQTILRRIMDLPPISAGTVVLLGIDDFSFRRGQWFGTILVNLESHRIIDLLPDRRAETVAWWMRRHPDLAVVSRDRGGEYASAAAQAAPQAIQVADRFHVVKNLAEATQLLLARCQADIMNAHQPNEPESGEADKPVIALTEWRPLEPAQVRQVRLTRRAGRYARYEQVVELSKQGRKPKEIAQQLALGERTVREWLKRGTFPETKKRRKRPSDFDAFAPFVLQRWQEGERNGIRLARELQAQGYRGSERTVYRYLETLKQTEVQESADLQRLQKFTATTAVWLFVRDPNTLDEIERTDLMTFCQASPTLRKAYDLIQEFLSIVHQREGQRLDGWVAQVASSKLPELQHFAAGIERDKAAVKAGLTWSINNGQVEGQVTKLKLIKRQMYGKAGFALLRQRVLHAL